MSRIEVICPACGHVFSASENWRGATVQCPACADSVLVGAEQAESDELLDPWGDDEAELTLAPAEDAVLTESPPAATECPQCSAPLPPGEPLCDHCGFSLRLNKPLEIESPDESTGFARWFNAQLEEGESVSSVLVFFELVMGIFAVILAVLFRPWSWFLLVPLIGAYLYLRFSGRAFGTLFWNRLLSVQRILG